MIASNDIITKLVIHQLKNYWTKIDEENISQAVPEVNIPVRRSRLSGVA